MLLGCSAFGKGNGLLTPGDRPSGATIRYFQLTVKSYFAALELEKATMTAIKSRDDFNLFRIIRLNFQNELNSGLYNLAFKTSKNKEKPYTTKWVD